MAQLTRMAENGQITKDYWICPTGASEWVPVTAINEINAVINGKKDISVAESSVNTYQPVFDIQGTTLYKYTGNRGNVKIPNGINVINDSAFRDCANLISVTIPKGVAFIGNSAFAGCSSLSAVTIPDGIRLLPKITTTHNFGIML